MRAHVNSLRDLILFWQLDGEPNAFGEPSYLPPVVIKGRWEAGQTSVQVSDGVETETSTIKVFPDRVLVIGSAVMLGDEKTLEAMTPEQVKNPRHNKDCKTIKEQQVFTDLRHRQSYYAPNTKGNHLVIECGTV